jgi:membrane associated rhomboid family serine protease
MKRYAIFQTLTGQLIAATSLVWLILLLLQMSGSATSTQEWVSQYCALPSSFSAFLQRPWTLLTYSFVHVHTGHFLINVLGLYGLGIVFESQVGKQLWGWVYALGMLMGAVFYWISFQIYPNENHFLLGNSASTMAIMGGMLAVDARRKINFLGVLILEVRWWFLIFVLLDWIGVRQGWNIGGHFAHTGGALAGYLFMYWKSTRRNSIDNPFAMKRPKTDDQFNDERKQREDRLNAILDKINRSGFDSLSAHEKAFLESESKK